MGRLTVCIDGTRCLGEYLGSTPYDNSASVVNWRIYYDTEKEDKRHQELDLSL